MVIEWQIALKLDYITKTIKTCDTNLLTYTFLNLKDDFWLQTDLEFLQLNNKNLMCVCKDYYDNLEWKLKYIFVI